MSTFPIYDNLMKDLPKKDLTKKQKDTLIQCLDTVDQTCTDRMYVLIMFYFLEHGVVSGNANTVPTTDLSYALPYGCHVQSNTSTSSVDLTWDLANLPISLRQLLFKFLNMHMTSMREDTTLHSLV